MVQITEYGEILCVGAGGVQYRYFVLVEVAVRVNLYNKIWLYVVDKKDKGACNRKGSGSGSTICFFMMS